MTSWIPPPLMSFASTGGRRKRREALKKLAQGQLPIRIPLFKRGSHMPYTEFKIIEEFIKDKDYSAYEPEKYHCVAVDDDFIDDW